MKTMPTSVDMPPVAVVEVEKVEEAPGLAQNDSSEGLARMQADLAPLAASLKSAAAVLLCLSFLMCGSLEGMFGMAAAMSVLCCAAPGPLGTAYAARCTRICAIICAGIALGQLLFLTSISFMLPTLPHHVSAACERLAPPAEAAIMPPMRAEPILMIDAVPAQEGLIAAPDPVPESVYASIETHEMTVTVLTVVGRKLQQVAPMAVTEVQCERAERFAAEIAPLLVMAAMLVETAVFCAALRTVKAAARLTAAARSYGANAI